MSRMMLSIAFAVALLSGIVYAGEHAANSPTTKPAAAPTTKPVNEMCAVESKNPVDDREILLYKGQWIGFCCEDCKADFKKDPDKYAARLNNP